MNMKCIYDIPRFCDVNIAIDEIFFTKENFEEIFRFYRWLKPSYTIGYFQKYPVKEDSYPVIRRLTGGLSVLHNQDLSYSLIVSDKMWPYIYNQEKTYKLVHETIRKSLKTINIICDDTSKKVDTIKNYCCVNTLYKDYEVHILGYFPDATKPDFKRKCRHLQYQERKLFCFYCNT